MKRFVILAMLLVTLMALADPALASWGWLGVRIRDLSEQEIEEISKKYGLREGFGAVIVEVMQETPAEDSGLKSGDLVVAFRDRLVVDTRTFQRLIASTSAGETVPLTVLRRDAGRHGVTVRVGRMPDTIAADRIAAEFGFLVRDPTGERGGGAFVRLADGPPAVGAVVARSPAGAAGLKVGDVLVEINGRAVLSLAAVREALLASSLERPLSLMVRRDSERVTLLLTAPSQ